MQWPTRDPSPGAPPRRFALVVASVSLTLLGLTAVVLQRGNQTDLQPLAVDPGPGSTISTRPELRLTYRRPLELDSLVTHVTLDPPVPLAVDVSGGQVRLRPERPLEPDRDYSLRIAPGLRDRSGGVVRSEQRLEYQSRVPRLLLLRAEATRGPSDDRLWTSLTDGTEALPLSPADLSVQYASVAPDGGAVAFTATPRGDLTRVPALWITARDGNAPRRLAPDDEAGAYTLGWSPRGDLIVYERRDMAPGLVAGGRRPGPPRLWGVHPDGVDVGPVYGRGPEQGLAPTWSQDGTRLGLYDPAQRVAAVFNFTRDVIIWSVSLPAALAWAPDNRQMAYVDLAAVPTARRDLRTAVYVRTLDTPDARALTPTGDSDADPVWSPTEGTLAVRRRTADRAEGIWFIGLDGDQSSIQAESGWEYGAPVWSVDGRALYWSRRGRGGSDTRWEVWRAEVDRPVPTRLAGDGRVLAMLP